MKVLLINGSPHKHGCTFTALNEVETKLNEHGIKTEIYHIGTKPIAGCIACGQCRETGHCVFDDQVNMIAAKLDEYDGFVFGSPVYYAAPTGQLCAFLDRLFYSSGSRMAGKPGAAVVSCRRGGASCAFDQLNKYFMINNMPVVPSQYWNQVHGNTPMEVLQDAEGLQTMRTLGENMAWILMSISSGRKAALPEPARETPIITNFVR